jgi:hypothetical protein
METTKRNKAYLLDVFDKEIDPCDLAGMAARAAIEVLLDNWHDAGDELFPGDVDDVIALLNAWKEKISKDLACSTLGSKQIDDLIDNIIT